MSNPSRAKRLEYVDCLRGLAATAVLYQHVVEESNLTPLKATLDLSPGLFGVVLFFLLSGYVIPFSVNERFRPTTFIVRRAFRILPAYYALIACVGLFPVLGFHVPELHSESLSARGWIANLLLVQDFVGQPPIIGVAWTLILEIIWYAFFVAVFLRFGHRRIVETSVAYSVVCIALGVVALVAEKRVPFGRIGFLDAALLGYAAFGWHQGLINTRGLSVATAFFLVATVFTQWVGFGHFQHRTMTVAHVMWGWLLPTALFFVFMTVRSVRESSAARFPAFVKLGEISYSVYLMHCVLLAIHLQFVGPDWVWLVVPIATLVLGWLMYSTVEQAGIRLGRQLTAPRQTAKALA